MVFFFPLEIKFPGFIGVFSGFAILKCWTSFCLGCFSDQVVSFQLRFQPQSYDKLQIKVIYNFSKYPIIAFVAFSLGELIKGQADDFRHK